MSVRESAYAVHCLTSNKYSPTCLTSVLWICCAVNKDNDKMASSDLAFGFVVLSQTVLGILGNSVLLCCFIIADLSGIVEKPTDLIVKHLT